jgi:hypothetical protein
MAKKTAKKPAAPLYDWGPGGKVHTIPLGQHQQDVRAQQRYGIDIKAPVSTPLTNQQAYGLAEASANREYQPQIQAAQQMGANAQPWFQDYIRRTAAAQQQAAAYAQPVLNQAAQWANQPAAAAPGLDPNSQAGQQSSQAASSGQGLAKLGADVLASVAQSTSGYMAGQQDTAAAQIPVAQAYYGQQAAQLGGQREQAVSDNYGKTRVNEQNAQLAYQTLGLNTAKAAADASNTAKTITQRTRIAKQKAAADAKKAADKAAADAREPNKYGIPNGQWERWSSGHRQRVIDAYDKSHTRPAGQTPEQKAAAKQKAADAKRITKKRETSGKFTSRIQDAVGDWDMLTREPVPVPDRETVKDGKKINVPQKPRAATPDEVRRAMRKKGYTPQEIHIALLRRVGKPLDPAAIAYMHAQGMSIPRDWRPSKGRGVSKAPSQAPTKQDPYGSGPGHH